MRIKRTITLLSYLIKNLTFSQFIGTIKTTLFRNQLIYVLAIDPHNLTRSTSAAENHVSDSGKKVMIKKGEIEELNEFCSRTGENAWEFNCYNIDGVKDFFIAHDANVIQCIVWIYGKYDPSRLLVLREKDAILQYGLTLSQFRGRGLLPSVEIAAVRHLHRQGFQRVFVTVDSRNKASLRSQEKVGFVKVGEVRLRKVFGLQISRKLDMSQIS